MRVVILCNFTIAHHIVCIYLVDLLRKQDSASADDNNGKKNKDVWKSAGLGQEIKGFLFGWFFFFLAVREIECDNVFTNLKNLLIGMLRAFHLQVNRTEFSDKRETWT